ISERALERVDDRRHAAVAAAFADKAAAGPQRAPNAGDHIVGPLHPVQRRIAEDRVELGVEAELLSVHDAAIQPARTRGGNLSGAAVDPDDVTADCNEPLSERAVTAAEIQDALSCARRKQLDDRRARLGAEAGVSGVPLGTHVL